MAQLQMQWPPFTDKLKVLAVVLFTLWFASVMVAPLGAFVDQYMLVSQSAVFQGQVWTIFTYSLWHADFIHLLFNVGVIWLFGGEISARWSNLEWWRFNALCVLGGGLAVVLAQLIFGSQPTLGYSAAVMGIIAAFAWQNWDRTIYLFFFPMKGKTLLIVVIVFDAFRYVAGTFSNAEPISIAAHLGGLATGLLIVTGWWRPSRLKRRWTRYRQRRKFKVIRKEAEKDYKYLN